MTSTPLPRRGDVYVLTQTLGALPTGEYVQVVDLGSAMPLSKPDTIGFRPVSINFQTGEIVSRDKLRVCSLETFKHSAFYCLTPRQL